MSQKSIQAIVQKSIENGKWWPRSRKDTFVVGTLD